MSSSLTPRLASLLHPEAYPHPVGSIQLVETHVSWVFLTGRYAYKVKKPVCYPFLDLRSREHRAFFCAEELRLNRRFAPELYRDVCPVTFDGRVARICGPGEVIDHAVCMRQFRAENELDRLLTHGLASPADLEGFGRDLAMLHERLPVAGARAGWGQPQRVRALLLRNAAECRKAAERCGTADAVASLGVALGARLDAAEPWMTRRRSAGRIRECHGDLHARNVVRYDNRFVAFDCIEFAPDFRWIDVAADVAFLFMDLDARGCPEHAQAFLNGYLGASGDYEACRLLRLYAVDRALVRAKVTALQAAGMAQKPEAANAMAEHRTYVECAQRMVAAEAPLLILTCGLSGSGKSWLAQRLAARLRAVLLRSDVERSRKAVLAGWRSPVAPGEGRYSSRASRDVYGRLGECAAEVLAGGSTVIVDATFQRSEDRARLRAIAADCGVTMRVIFCHAPPEVLQRRVVVRGRSGIDASEADLAVLQWQRTRFEAITSAEDLTVIDADTTATDVVEHCLRELAVA